MALIQMMSVKGLKTFGDLFDTILKMGMKPFQNCNCQRVNVTFDRYDVIDLIKSFERRRSQKSLSFEMKISGPENALPKQWKIFSDHSKNKASPLAFICEQWSWKASSMLVAGQCLIIAGGFKGVFVTSKVTKEGSCRDETLSCNHEEADTRLIFHGHMASLASQM